MKIGDIVRLKSGGPNMTVTRANQLSDHLACQWMDEAGHLQEAFFAADALITLELDWPPDPLPPERKSGPFAL